jgi:O-antigen/teichoic acid export membrane protein
MAIGQGILMTQIELAADLQTSADRTRMVPLAERTVKAGLLTTGGRLFTKCLDLLTLLILARFLGPAEFGLVAMAMAPVLIVETVCEMPLSAALLNEKQPTEAMYDTALTLAALRALTIVILLVIMAWPLSLFFQEPGLTPLLCVLSLAPAMRGLVSQRLTDYARVMDFRRDVALDISAKAGALLIASILAISTGSYWAIAIGKVSSTAIAMIASYALAPQRIRFTLREWHLFADMLGWTSARQILSAINWQADKIVLPRFVDIGTFGQFSWADTLISVPAQAILQPITPPLYAAFALAKQTGSLARVYLKASAGVFTIMAPLFLLIGMLSAPIVAVILGPAWQETAPILTWLSFAAIGYAPTVLLPALAMSLNRTRVAFEKLALEFCIKVPLIIILTVMLSLEGLLIGHVIAAVAGFLINLILVGRLLPLGIFSQIADLIRPTISMVPMALFLVAAQGIFDPGEGMLATVVNLTWVSALALAIFGVASLTLWRFAGCPDSCEATILRMVRKFFRHAVKEA